MWKKVKERKEGFAFNSEKVFLAAARPTEAAYNYFQTSPIGLTPEAIEQRQALYGPNEVAHEQKKRPLSTFVKAFINPFIGVLTGLVIISFVLDVLLAAPGEQDWTAIIIILVMVIVSAVLRFWQEWKANLSSEALLKMVTNTCYVCRAGKPDMEISISELVPGDVVKLAAGDMIPADLRIVEAKDLFVSQSSLTGESDPIEKRPENQTTGKARSGSVVELDNICFMGSNVVSGSATGIVFATGNHTYLGTIAKNITGHRADQLPVRHRHLLGHVVRLQMRLTNKPNPFPIRLVHRGIAVADTHRPHDPDTQDPILSESCLLASHRLDAFGGRYWNLDSL